MRITEGMLTRRVTYNLSSSAESMLDTQNQISSGKRLTKPSDDIPATNQAMRMRSALSQISQFGRNTAILKNQLALTNTALDSVVSNLQDVNRLAIQAGNATLDDGAKAAIAAQLDSISTSLLSAANTQFAGKHLFSGGLTDKEAIVVNPAGDPPYKYQGDNAAFNVQVAPETYITGNVTADAVFNMNSSAVAGSPDIFKTISLLRKEITDGDVTAISNRLTDISANLRNATAIRSQVGSRMSRMEATNTMMVDSKDSLSQLLSDTEDVDMAQAAVDLAQRENIYQAAAATASKILQVSLTNYMK